MKWRGGTAFVDYNHVTLCVMYACRSMDYRGAGNDGEVKAFDVCLDNQSFSVFHFSDKFGVLWKLIQCLHYRSGLVFTNEIVSGVRTK